MDMTELLTKVKSGELTPEQAQKLMSGVKAPPPEKILELEVSPKGCISIKGIRRFPIALYYGEINLIFKNKDKILKFMEDNKSKLKTREWD